MSKNQDLVAPELKVIFEYWIAMRDARGGTPLRADFDVLDLPPKSWPYVALVEVEDGASEAPLFNFRLVGTHMAHGIDPTGLYLHEAAPEGRYREHIVSLYQRGWREAPLYSLSNYLGDDNTGTRDIHRMFLPMVSTEGGDPDMMLVGQQNHGLASSALSLWQYRPTDPEIRAFQLEE